MKQYFATITEETVERVFKDRRVKKLLTQYLNGELPIQMLVPEIGFYFGSYGYAPELILKVESRDKKVLKEVLSLAKDVQGIAYEELMLVDSAVKAARSKVFNIPVNRMPSIDISVKSASRTQLLRITRFLKEGWENFTLDDIYDVFPDFLGFAEFVLEASMRSFSKNTRFSMSRLNIETFGHGFDEAHKQISIVQDPDHIVRKEMETYYLKLSGRPSKGFLDRLVVQYAFFDAKEQLKELVPEFDTLDITKKVALGKMWVKAQHEAFNSANPSVSKEVPKLQSLKMEIGFLNGSHAEERFLESFRKKVAPKKQQGKTITKLKKY